MPKWKVALLHGLLLIFISYFSLSVGYDYDYEDAKGVWGRCPWIRNTLKNGRVRVRSRGRIAKFICKSGYELVGKKFATCVRGQWNNPVPVCIAKGCPRITAIANGIVTEKYKGAQLIFDCNPGYSLQGDASINCDGSQWDKSAPRCEAASLQPQKFCDFEDPDLCGWSHDPNHDFDWRRHQFKTPSGHVGTGPSYDHTFGKGKAGYYMYEEASSPRNVNDSSRLFSPVYSTSNSPGCFVFWYHMYGSTIGRLRIYIKPESHVFVELTPVWEKSGEQGNQWLRGNVTVPQLNENFQIVIEGIRGVSYLGDTAIDDVNLLNTSCSSLESFNATEGEEASRDSCRGRCHESDNFTSCGCTDACESDNTCCSDYTKLCAGGNEPLNGEDETATGKLETDGTPEDRVGTEYTATTPTLSTEFVTLLENSSTVTANNNQQPPIQVPTSVVPTASTSTITVRMNSSTGTATISAPTVPIVQVSVSRKTTESVSPATHTTRNVTSEEISTVKATTATSVILVSITKAATTATPSTTATTVAIPLTITPQTTKTVAFTAGVTNSTSFVSGATSVTTVTSKQSTTTNTPTEPTTIETAMSPIGTTESTTVTISTTKTFVPPVVTVPSAVRTPINTPTNSEAVTSESVKPTSFKSSTSTTRMTTTSRVTNSQSTGRTSQTPTTARITFTSTTRTTPTTVSTSTQAPVMTVRTYRPPPPPRRPTVQPTTTTTLSTYFRSRTTTKTTKLASVFYTAKFRMTTVATVRDGSSELKSQTVVPKSNRSTVIGTSIGVIAIICLIGGVTFVFLRRRRQKLDKLHGDSIRFLPDNEVIEYSEASVTDSLFQS